MLTFHNIVNLFLPALKTKKSSNTHFIPFSVESCLSWTLALTHCLPFWMLSVLKTWYFVLSHNAISTTIHSGCYDNRLMLSCQVSKYFINKFNESCVYRPWGIQYIAILGCKIESRAASYIIFTFFKHTWKTISAV